MTRNLRGRLASVGLAQARPNNSHAIVTALLCIRIDFIPYSLSKQSLPLWLPQS